MILLFRNIIYSFFILAFFIFIYLAFYHTIENNQYIAYLYTLVLFPLYDKIIDIFSGEKIFSQDIFDWKKYTTSYTIAIGVWFLAWYMGQPLGIISLLLGATLGILFWLNSKITFFAAFIFLLYIPLFLILWDYIMAESLSIYVYYFLVIGIALELRESLYPKMLTLWK